MSPTTPEDVPPPPGEGIELGQDREQRAHERRSRALARAAEDREQAEALPEGPHRDRLEHAARTQEQAAELHEEAARLQHLHQSHEAQRAENADAPQRADGDG